MNAVTIFDPQQIPTIERLAKSMANSGMFGVKSSDAALAVMLMAQAEGLHPAMAMRDYHVIEGRPALKADAMLARFLNAGGKLEYHQSDDEACEATFSHPQTGSLKVRWDMKRATLAGLNERAMWKKYRSQMLRARTISEGVRAIFPGVAVGTYTVEEAQDMALDVQPAAELQDARVIDTTPKTMDPDTLADYLRVLGEATDLKELQAEFGKAWGLAKAATDQDALQWLKGAYDTRKAYLLSLEPQGGEE